MAGASTDYRHSQGISLPGEEPYWVVYAVNLDANIEERHINPIGYRIIFNHHSEEKAEEHASLLNEGKTVGIVEIRNLHGETIGYDLVVGDEQEQQ